MSKKITKKELNKIIQQVTDETTKSFAEDLEKTYGPNRSVPLQEVVDDIIPKAISDAFVNSRSHTAFIIHDILEKLDILIDDEDH